jgi:hypothetical protein
MRPGTTLMPLSRYRLRLRLSHKSPTTSWATPAI